MADAGAAVVVPDHEMSAARLAAEVGALLGDPARLSAMMAASAALARPDAARLVADQVLEAARGASEQDLRS
jgi:UDP-N-acetylglucosamine--N-acetylmuramyl-(pentapeptide) pyrophosphoryl-undecaprenol N-acetylglucosamine transferase